MLTVMRAGMYTTVQDCGRDGLRQSGVSRCGAMDKPALMTANLLVGTVQEVVPEQSGKSSSAVILPGADPRTVKHVFIVTEY